MGPFYFYEILGVALPGPRVADRAAALVRELRDRAKEAPRDGILKWRIA